MPDLNDRKIRAHRKVGEEIRREMEWERRNTERYVVRTQRR